MTTSNSINDPEVIQTMMAPRHIPTLAYTVQNIFMTMASMMASTATLFFTTCFILPLSMLRAIMPLSVLQHPNANGMNKVVLVIGASHGIGYSVLKQYMDEPDTVVIATARHVDALRQVVSELGNTSATIECADLDLTGGRQQLVERIQELDKSYGPITHLYEVNGVSNHLKDSTQWGLDVIEDMINKNVVGMVACVMTMFELMKQRRFGKICIVGSAAGLYGPANMISYASTNAFVNTFSTSLRVLAAPCGIEVVTIQPGFIDTLITKHMRGLDSSVPVGMAILMKRAVDNGGVGVVNWPFRQSVAMSAVKSFNPICEELGRWASTKMLGVSGKKLA